MLDFLHHHPLEEIQNNTSEYLRDGYKTSGVSTRYRCNFCDLGLHESCAISSPTLASFLHSQHELIPMVLTSYLNTTPPCHICNFCGDEIKGLFYRCNICNFDMHPACTQLPEYISYHGHFIHPLRLESGPVGVCSTCFDVCTSWRYRCGTCGFNIHLGCMSAPPSSPPFPIPSPFYAGTAGIPPSGYVGIGAPAANYAVYNNNPQQYVNASQYASGSSGAAGIPPAGIGFPAANYPVYNNNPQQYVNANQYASGSSGSVSSKGKSKFRKKVGSVVGRLAITIALGALGIPDVFFFL